MSASGTEMTALQHFDTPADLKPPSFVLQEVSYSSTQIIVDSLAQLLGFNVCANRISKTLLKPEQGDTKDLIQQQFDS